MTRLTSWINIALLDDEPLARQRLRRLVENWSWEVSCPSDAAATLPTLWAWLLVRAERDEFDNVQATLPPLDERHRPSTTTRRLVRAAWAQDDGDDEDEAIVDGTHDPASIMVRARLVIEAKDPKDFDQRAAERINARPLDIILADVRLPGDENGVAFAARWQAGVQSPVVVMVSAFEDSAAQAFNIDAADYVVKPVRAERLAAALCRGLAKKASRESAHAAWAQPMVQVAQRGPGNETVITVSERGRLMNILVDDIVMFRSELKYTTIHTRHRQYLSETSVSRFAQQYDGRFLKVHRGCLIGWAHVDGLIHEQRRKGDGEMVKGRVWFLKMKGLDEPIEISRRLWSVVAQRFKINPFLAYRKEYVTIDVRSLDAPDPLLDANDATIDDQANLDDETFFSQEQVSRDFTGTTDRPLNGPDAGKEDLGEISTQQASS